MSFKQKVLTIASGTALGGAGLFVYLLYGISNLLALCVYIWSLIIAFFASGLGSAILTGIFPVVGQLYWAFWAWNKSGTLLNGYCLSVMAVVLGYALSLGGWMAPEYLAGKVSSVG